MHENKNTALETEPRAQCYACNGNGSYTIGQYHDGEFREGLCQTCEGRGWLSLNDYFAGLFSEMEEAS